MTKEQISKSITDTLKHYADGTLEEEGAIKDILALFEKVKAEEIGLYMDVIDKAADIINSASDLLDRNYDDMYNDYFEAKTQLP